MPFDWKEYLDLAFLLQKQSSTSQEALLRSAVGKAYYAAYHHALEYAHTKLGFIPRTGRHAHLNHKLLKEHFRTHGYTSIAQNLTDLRRWRNACDYCNTVSDVSRKCANSIRLARSLFATLT